MISYLIYNVLWTDIKEKENSLFGESRIKNSLNQKLTAFNL